MANVDATIVAKTWRMAYEYTESELENTIGTYSATR